MVGVVILRLHDFFRAEKGLWVECLPILVEPILNQIDGSLNSLVLASNDLRRLR